MNRLVSVSALVILAAFGAKAAIAQHPSTESTLLKESIWLLQSGKDQQFVWFEPGRESGVELVMCRGNLNCRTPVIFDDHGFHVETGHGLNFPFALTTPNVPIFASQGGSFLMPAWVVPVAGSRTGH